MKQRAVTTGRIFGNGRSDFIYGADEMENAKKSRETAEKFM